jgi:DNA-binding XRE family transcriptional regulator
MQTKSRTKRETRNQRFVAGSSRVPRNLNTLRAQMAAAVQDMARAERDIEQGRRIKELRVAQHLTQQALADRIHVDKRTLQFWESGTVNPSWENKKALARALKTSADYIANGPQAGLEASDALDLSKRLESLEAKLDELLKKLP